MDQRRIINVPGQPHFVTFSTYQRRQFLAPVRSREIVMESLQSGLQTHHVLCHGFVIMPNHVHAVLSLPPALEIAAFLSAWKKTSSYRVKRFYQQELTNYAALCPPDGPVWQARFYDFNIESPEKLHEKLNYMHNNPVVAKLVDSPLDWKWSSARFYELGEIVEGSVTVSL